MLFVNARLAVTCATEFHFPSTRLPRPNPANSRQMMLLQAVRGRVSEVTALRLLVCGDAVVPEACRAHSGRADRTVRLPLGRVVTRHSRLEFRASLHSFRGDRKPRPLRVDESPSQTAPPENDCRCPTWRVAAGRAPGRVRRRPLDRPQRERRQLRRIRNRPILRNRSRPSTERRGPEHRSTASVRF